MSDKKLELSSYHLKKPCHEGSLKFTMCVYFHSDESNLEVHCSCGKWLGGVDQEYFNNFTSPELEKTIRKNYKVF